MARANRDSAAAVGTGVTPAGHHVETGRTGIAPAGDDVETGGAGFTAVHGIVAPGATRVVRGVDTRVAQLGQFG